MQVEHEIRVTVRVERRRDGGLRAWSDDVPGLVLSHRDPQKVLADIAPVLIAILSEQYGCRVEVAQTGALPAAVRAEPVIRRAPTLRPFFNFFNKVEYAASPCHA
jgi:hypothetical protein